MTEKTRPLGICDHCGNTFPSGVSLYTSKGRPRRYCSLECKNTANSRAGAPIRAQKMKTRVKRGEWQNPAECMTEDERREYAVRGGQARAAQHLAAIESGEWQNPADAPGAREKLSLPRKHRGVLHSALEKLHQGLSVADLTPEEAEAHRLYRRQMRQADRGRSRRYGRESYRRQMATEAGSAAQRSRWQQQQERRRQHGPNLRLRQAREAAGYSRRQLAQLLGVSQSTIASWENYSTMPKVEIRGQIEAILGHDLFSE